MAAAHMQAPSLLAGPLSPLAGQSFAKQAVSPSAATGGLYPQGWQQAMSTFQNPSGLQTRTSSMTPGTHSVNISTREELERKVIIMDQYFKAKPLPPGQPLTPQILQDAFMRLRQAPPPYTIEFSTQAEYQTKIALMRKFFDEKAAETQQGDSETKALESTDGCCIVA